MNSLTIWRDTSEERLSTTTAESLDSVDEIFYLPNEQSSTLSSGALKVRSQNQSLSRKWTPSNELKSVSFSYIDVRSYPVILGDNPSVSGGAPLSIGWESVSSEQIHIDDIQPDSSSSGRSVMKLGKTQRQELLLELGYSKESISFASAEAILARLLREESTNDDDDDNMENNETIKKQRIKGRKGLGIFFKKNPTSDKQNKKSKKQNKEQPKLKGLRNLVRCIVPTKKITLRRRATTAKAV